MVAWDLLLVGLMVGTPLLLYAHGRRLLRRGAPPPRVAAAVAGYQLMALAALGYILGTDLPARLEGALNQPGLGVLAFMVPFLIVLPCLYPAYLLDRQSRGSQWTFGEYLRASAARLFAVIAFVIPLLVGWSVLAPLLQRRDVGRYVRHHPWVLLAAILLLVALGVVAAWLVLRWGRPRLQAVESALARRLTALGEQLGVVPASIELLPTRGGRIANALVTGLRAGRARVLLTDFLVENFAPEEIELIFAHEVAHIRLGHIRVRLWLTVAVYLSVLGLGGLWIYWAAVRLELAMPWAVAPIGLLTLLARPWPLLVARRQEFAADAWAGRMTGRPLVLAAALARAEELNQFRSEQLPRWIRPLVTHPIMPRRIAALRAQAGEGT